MTTSTTRIGAQDKKRLHLVMRDGTLIEAHAVVAEDMPLVTFLSTRKGGWLNAPDGRRPKLAEEPTHLVIQADLVLLASAPDANMHIATFGGVGSTERLVELRLHGGNGVRGTIYLAAQQRLSDYLSQAGKFIGVAGATILPDGRPAGDIAVNVSAIGAATELAHR